MVEQDAYCSSLRLRRWAERIASAVLSTRPSDCPTKKFTVPSPADAEIHVEIHENCV